MLRSTAKGVRAAGAPIGQQLNLEPGLRPPCASAWEVDQRDRRRKAHRDVHPLQLDVRSERHSEHLAPRHERHSFTTEAEKCALLLRSAVTSAAAAAAAAAAGWAVATGAASAAATGAAAAGRGDSGRRTGDTEHDRRNASGLAFLPDTWSHRERDRCRELLEQQLL